MPQTSSWQRFVFNACKVAEDFRAIYNLEEELIAVMRPNMSVTEGQKDAVRTRILTKLIEKGSVSGSWQEIQTKLGLRDVPLGLFKRSCWHLSAGDRDPQGKSRIRVRRETDNDRASLYEPAPFIVSPL